MAEFFPEGGLESSDKYEMEMLEPADIARAIVYLLGEESDKISGTNLPVGTGAP